jgi:hypothetical protein
MTPCCLQRLTNQFLLITTLLLQGGKKISLCFLLVVWLVGVGRERNKQKEFPEGEGMREMRGGNKGRMEVQRQPNQTGQTHQTLS